jgi:hypothetical protein
MKEERDDGASEERDESEEERLDRNLNELLQELRVAQTGVQILFAFLLTLPFTNRFQKVTNDQRLVYYATLLLAGFAAMFIIAPVPFHRIVFRHHDKKALVFNANFMALAGLGCLSLAMTGVILFITDFLFHAGMVFTVTTVFFVVIMFLWFALPLWRVARAKTRE